MLSIFLIGPGFRTHEESRQSVYWQARCAIAFHLSYAEYQKDFDVYK